MKSLTSTKIDLEFDKFWSSLKEEWFKVEVLQYYEDDMSESLNLYLKGQIEESIALIEKSANEYITDKSEDFKKIRIHIIDMPLSEYLKWEIEVYKRINIPLENEYVYLIDRKKLPNTKLPKGDFMIFDNKKVIQNNYDRNGKMISMDFYNEDDDISKYLELKKQLQMYLNGNNKI